VTATSATARSRPEVVASRSARFRADIQGLRAIAVLSVLLYHADIPGVPGGFIGVDIFFVISGFLISGHLLSELRREGRISFARFYARRARRILPASFVVLIATTAGVAALVPPALQPSFLTDATATAAYVPNMIFAWRGTDYLAETAPSPFQHYWSLGVEEQFYALWPLLLLLLWVVLRRRETRIGAAVAVLVAASMVGAALLTFVSQPWAFFSLPTRAGELGAGALVAIAAPALARVPRPVAAVVGWVALAAVIASVLVITGDMAFPGVVVLWPVLATALVIAAGSADGARSTELLLGRAPMQFAGRISYSLYLVHWPLIVIPALAMGGTELTGWPAVVALLVTFPLAWVLYRVVEVPFQRAEWSTKRRPRTVFAIVLAISVVIAGAAQGLAYSIRNAPLDAGKPASDHDVAAPPVFQDFVPSNMTPSIAEAADDLPATYADGCHLSGSDLVVPPEHCVFGDTDSESVVALFGDSHAAQWFPALEELATSEGFRLDVYTKSSCPSVRIAMVMAGVRDTGCDAWRDAVIQRLAADPPQRIVLSNFAHYDDVGNTGIDQAGWNAGLAETLSSLPASSEVTLITDTPSFEGTPAVCLSSHLTDALACSRPRAEAIDADWAKREAATARGAGAQVVDLDSLLCDREQCGVIIGSHLLYRDPHHLTASYARELSAPLAEALGW